MQFYFSDQCLDTDRRELYRGSQRVDVQPQVFDVLVYLVQNSDRVISRDELISEIWNGRIVSESTLTSRINAARKAIGDNGLDQKLIRTIPRKGFLFIGALQSRPQAPPSERNADTPPAQKRADDTHSASLALDKPAVAILPFKNISGEPAQEYFSEGISDDIITALSKIRWFYVVARNSSFNYRGQSVPLKEVGEQLGVSYVVEGSVRKDGERVRISVQLSNVSTGIHIWSERYDRSLADVFSVQDEITQAIVGAIEPQLYAAENFRAQRKTPDSMDAWDLVVRALSYYWRVTRRDNMVAQALLEKTISIDPNYGQALGLLAASHMFDVHMGWANIKVAMPAAELAALAAIRADGEDSWAHYALASVYLFTRRFDESFAEFELALRLNPSFSPARAYYCGALSFCGEWEKGYTAVRHALRLSPRDPFAGVYFGFAGFAQFIGGNYDAAIHLAREALRMRGDYAGAHRVLTAAAAMAGHDQMARDALRDLRRAQPSISQAWIKNQMPFRRDAERSRYSEALGRAGLK